jgi:chemotaxis protein CheX
MKVEYINPFIESVYDLFTTMLSSKAQRGNVGVSRGASNPREIMALIGLSGPARGTVAISFPTETAVAIVNRLLGTDTKVIDDTVSDAIAEIVNIVAGGAKAKLKIGEGSTIDLSLPTVVRGDSYDIDYPSNSVWLEVPFDSDLGPFSMRVTFEMDRAAGAAGKGGSA